MTYNANKTVNQLAAVPHVLSHTVSVKSALNVLASLEKRYRSHVAIIGGRLQATLNTFIQADAAEIVSLIDIDVKNNRSAPVELVHVMLLLVKS